MIAIVHFGFRFSGSEGASEDVESICHHQAAHVFALLQWAAGEPGACAEEGIPTHPSANAKLMQSSWI
jgi:hypothetical protein